jgi:hypothetical protein
MRGSLAAAVAVGLLVAGCGGDGHDTATTSVTSQPPTSALTGGVDPNLIDLPIGRRVNVGCRKDETSLCDFHLVVTKIQEDAPCDRPQKVAGPDEQYLRFDLDVSSTADKFVYGFSDRALTLRHWGVVDKDGKLMQDLVLDTDCGQGTAILSRVSPGTHTTSIVVVTAPKRAAALRLLMPGWSVQWAI